MKFNLDGIKKRFEIFRFDDLLLDPGRYSLSESELMADLDPRGNDLLLGQYTVDDVSKSLNNYGVWDALRAKGYPEPVMHIRSIDPFRQRITLKTDQQAPEDEDHLLCDLRLYDAHLHAPCPLTGKTFELNALVIDWLNFQDPRASFTDARQKLPGQKYPGLGILRIAIRAILDLARQSGKEAVINIPEFYHNAVLYHPHFRFFSPFVEGRFQSLMQFLKPYSLAEASHMIEREELRNLQKQEPFIWKPHEQVLGLVPRVVDFFASPEYLRQSGQAREASTFELAPGKHASG